MEPVLPGTLLISIPIPAILFAASPCYTWGGHNFGYVCATWGTGCGKPGV